ncbi:MAG TPA: hypothetical protein GX517_05560 [Alicyclobacillus sp.]|nr:hypothetical protein [Alicyclobacillus sp.]
MVEVAAQKGTDSWPVRIEAREQHFSVSGRGTSFALYLTETDSGFLVSLPLERRCGHVPDDCSARDVMAYVGVENAVDAATLAAAIRCLAAEGFVAKHPAIPGGDI